MVIEKTKSNIKIDKKKLDKLNKEFKKIELEVYGDWRV